MPSQFRHCRARRRPCRRRFNHVEQQDGPLPDEIVKGVLTKLFDRDGMGAEAGVQRLRWNPFFFFDTLQVEAWRVTAEILIGCGRKRCFIDDTIPFFAREILCRTPCFGKNVMDINRRHEVGVNGYGRSGNKILCRRAASAKWTAPCKLRKYGSVTRASGEVRSWRL